MSLSRAIIGLLSSSAARSTRRLSSRHLPFAASAIAALSTAAAAAVNCSSERRPKLKPEAGFEKLGFAQRNANGTADPPRPPVVPFHPQVANAMHLVAAVGLPPQLQPLPDGSYAAVTVLVHGNTNNLPGFWIPTIFLGDLAQIAAYHLKENDVVYVMGKLSGDAPPPAFHEGQTNVLFLAHSLNYVRKESLVAGQHSVDGNDEPLVNVSDEDDNSSVQALWNEFFVNPDRWWDNRSYNSYPKYAAFKHKDTGQLLWINECTPEWVLLKLEQLQIGQKNRGKGAVTGNTKKPETFTDKSWHDILLNPQDWKDHRADKLNGLLKPKFPDFKHKNGQALWLNKAPSWVLEKLDTLTFGGSTLIKNAKEIDNSNAELHKTYQGKSLAASKTKNTESLWRALVDSPNQWSDNRGNKLNKNSPDFRHKESGEGLWLDPSTPKWVLLKLLSLHPKSLCLPETFTDKSWHDILLNPQDWKDHRADKLNGSLNPKFPDFKHKDGQALWLNKAPSWVLEKLDTLMFGGSTLIKNAKETELQCPIT